MIFPTNNISNQRFGSWLRVLVLLFVVALLAEGLFTCNLADVQNGHPPAEPFSTQ